MYHPSLPSLGPEIRAQGQPRDLLWVGEVRGPNRRPWPPDPGRPLTRLPCGRLIAPRACRSHEGFVITTARRASPHFCHLMVLVGHAALIVALLLSTPCPAHMREIIIAFMRPGARFNEFMQVDAHRFSAYVNPRWPCRRDRGFIPLFGYHVSHPHI